MDVNNITTSTAFWETLYTDSKEFEEPVMSKQFFSHPFLTEDEVRNIFINWTQQPFYQAVLDIDMGVKGSKRDRYDQLLYKLPFQSDKTLEELYYGLFKKKKASILLRSPERYYEPLAKRVANFIHPLIQQFGLPQFTWTTALIIGNYNYTPFGIHFDAGNQRAIHTMVGKGKKKMWFWKRDKVDKIIESHGINKLRYYSEDELPKLIPHGKSHLIEENDFYFLPNHHYHIAHVEEFTIGLAIAIDRIDQNSLVTKAIQSFMSYNLSDCLQQYSGLDFQSDSIDYMDLKKAEQKISNINWLADSVKGEILKRESNQGNAVAPRLKNAPHQDLNKFTIKINSPFRIKWLVNQNDLKLYVRNRVIPLSFDDSQEQAFSLIPIIRRLNNSEELKFSTIAKLLKDEMEVEDIAYLFKLFYSYGGVLFV